MALRFDLQSHSTHSDGALAAAEVVERAAEAGVELLALSDHDTVSGVSEAIEAGERSGVRIVPAVEISAVDEGAPVGRELHILGYDIDHTGPPMTDSARRVPRRPREAHAADARRRCARPASSSTRRRSSSASPRANRSAARTSPKRCSRAPANAAAAGRRADRRHRLADPRLSDRGQARLPPARDADRRRGRSRRSTRPAAWPSGRTPSGTCPRTRPKCSRASTASARSASTASRPSTSRTPASRPSCSAERCAELGLLEHRLGRLPRPRQPPVLALPRVRDLRPRAEPRVRSADFFIDLNGSRAVTTGLGEADGRCVRRRRSQQRLQAVGERLQRELLGDVQRQAQPRVLRPARSPLAQRATRVDARAHPRSARAWRSTA